MADEGFLRRWARKKSEVRSDAPADVREAREPAPLPVMPGISEAPLASAAPGAAAMPAPAGLAPHSVTARSAPPSSAPHQPSADRPPPTLDDLATLGADSDYSAFVARGVDQAVRRGALKKLFADPHFNVMDRLDVYIDDYTKPSPVSEAMLASLEHAKSVFMKLVEEEPAPEEQTLQQPPEQETQ
jgi:hypothetical protein